MRIPMILALTALISLPGCSVSSATTSAAPASAANAGRRAPEHVVLPAGGGRDLDVSVYAPAAAPQGVLFVSHGGGSSPTAMEPVIARLTAAGFVVFAPLHSDSVSLAADRRKSVQAAFGDRVADLGVTTGYARARYPGLPIGALGYSYGSLIALMGAGGLDYVAPARVPGLKAAVALSSPGIIPGLVDRERAYAKLAAPILVITGTADVVPGAVSDPAQHLLAFDTAPAGHNLALVIDGADHGSVARPGPGAEAAWAVMIDFLKANMLEDKGAAARLDAHREGDGLTVKRR